MILYAMKKVKRKIIKYRADYKYYKAMRILKSHEEYFSISHEDRAEKVVVSLTSYGRRLNTAHIAIESMLFQSYPPDKIILYLGSDVQQKDIPHPLLDLMRYGVEIRFKQGNLRSHKKYYYAMQDYPEALIVTIDDDLLYPSNLLEELVKGHEKYPNAVIAARVHEIRFNDDGKICPYMDWGYEYDGSQKNASFKYLATGCGGTLYPPGAIEKTFFDEGLIKELSYATDDLWLKIGEIKAGVPVKMIDAKLWKNTYEMPSAIDDALSNENVYGGINDVNMKKIIDYFNITKHDFME